MFFYSDVRPQGTGSGFARELVGRKANSLCVRITVPLRKSLGRGKRRRGEGEFSSQGFKKFKSRCSSKVTQGGEAWERQRWGKGFSFLVLRSRGSGSCGFPGLGFLGTRVYQALEFLIGGSATGSKLVIELRGIHAGTPSLGR